MCASLWQLVSGECAGVREHTHHSNYIITDNFHHIYIYSAYIITDHLISIQISEAVAQVNGDASWTAKQIPLLQPFMKNREYIQHQHVNLLLRNTDRDLGSDKYHGEISAQ